MNYHPAVVKSWLDGLPLKDNQEFDAVVNIYLNGKIINTESRVKIDIIEAHFRLHLLSNDLPSILPRSFDSRENIFTVEKPQALTVSGITLICSYKITIFQKE